MLPEKDDLCVQTGAHNEHKVEGRPNPKALAIKDSSTCSSVSNPPPHYNRQPQNSQNKPSSLVKDSPHGLDSSPQGIQNKDASFPQGAALSFTVGIVTATKGSVQKRILEDGSKDGSHSLSVSKGTYRNVSVDGLNGFAELIQNIRSNQALTLGTACVDGELNLYTNDVYQKLPDKSKAIARTKECIQRPTGTRLIVLDHDPEPGKPDLAWDEYWSVNLEVMPELAGVGRVVTTSTSSGIHNRATGECLKPENGHHTYILVRGSVERFVEIYKARCWLQGKAFFKLATPNQKTGTPSVLERFPSDTAVFSPERFVYEAGALLPHTLEQRRSAPRVVEGNVLDLDAIPDLTAEEKVTSAANKKAARDRIKGKQLDSAAKVIAATGHKQPRKEAARRIALCDRAELEPSHVLELASGGTLRVEDIGPQHDGLLLKDPQEPTYRNGAQTAKLYWNGDKPWRIHSEAHGGTNYSAAFKGFGSRPPAPKKKKTAAEIAQMAAYFRSKSRDFYGLTCDRTTINQRYITLNLQAPGTILAVSSDVETGKTYGLKQVKQEFFARHPDGYFDEQGYRNGLLRQKAERNGGDHIRDLECSDARFSQGVIDDSRELLYCIDSLNRRAPALREAIASGKRVCVVNDEGDAIVKHLAGGGTLSTRQAEIWKMWCDLLKAVIDGGGYIIVLEADLSQIAVDAIAEAAGNPPIVAIENTYRPHEGREVINHIAVNDEGEPSDNLLGKLCHIDVINAVVGKGRKAESLSDAIEIIDSGIATKNRAFLATDSQKLAREIHAAAIIRGLKVLRVDRETSELKEVQDFLKNPDAELAKHQYDLVIITTTAESGLSISDGYFDYVALYGSHLENRALKQLAARVRGMVPLHTYIRSRAIAVGEDPDSFTADGVLKSHQKNKEDSAIAAEVSQHFDAEVLMNAGASLATAEAVSLHKWQATFAARKNLSGAFLRANTLHLFEVSGHVISELVADGFDGEDETAYKIAREFVVNEKTKEYVTRPLDKSVSWAVQKLSANGCTYLESVEAQKVLDNDKWPGLPFNDPKFVKAEVIKKRRNGLKAHTFGWLCANPKIAKIIDLKSWKSQLEQPFIVLSALKREAAKVKVLAQSALNQIAELDAYTEDHPLIAEVASWAKERAETLGRLFRLQIRSHHTNIQTVNKLLRKIGYVSRKGKQLGGDGDRSYVWVAEPMPYQAEVRASLAAKWEAELSSESIEIEAPQQSTQSTRNIDFPIRVDCVSPIKATGQGLRVPIPIPPEPDNRASVGAAVAVTTQSTDSLADDYYDSEAWEAIA